MQRGARDITEWLLWFIGCMERAVLAAEKMLDSVLLKTRFWKIHNQVALTERQHKELNRLLDAGPGGFESDLSTRKCMSMTKTSRTTAWREIEDLLQIDLLQALPGGGRSTAYEVAWKNEHLQKL